MHNPTEIHSVMSELIKLTRMHDAQVECRIKKLGIHRSQHMALMSISKNNGKITQKNIADNCGISEAAVSVTVKKLEAEGYIQKINTAADARYNYLKLTDKGIKAVKESVDIFNAAEAKTFENITDEELKTFSEIILKMQDSINSRGGKE